MTIINILVWITAIISIASVIAAITPTPRDLNILKAKDKGD
jgi:hypothetical protein